MSTNPTFEPNKCYVHIVESPSARDLLDGRTEGRTLSSFLEISGIPCQYNLATNKETLEASLSDRIMEAVETLKAAPLIHFSLHGNQDGFGLTDGHFMRWKDLASCLAPINDSMDGRLLVCASACYGAAGVKMAFNDNAPLKNLIAPRSDVEWHVAALAFATFYHHLFKLGSTIQNAVRAMNAASGHDGFIEVDCAQIQRMWSQIESLPLETLRQSVQQLGRALTSPKPNASQAKGAQ